MIFGRLMMVLAAFGLASSAKAGLLSSCTLTLSTSGKLAMSGDGRTMSSQENGGLSAVMAVVGVDLVPKLSFSPLSVVGPSGWAGLPASYLSVDSLSGLRVSYTSTAFTITPGLLIDTLTMNARIVNSNGFKAGTYTASSTVTCEAA